MRCIPERNHHRTEVTYRGVTRRGLEIVRDWSLSDDSSLQMKNSLNKSDSNILKI